MAYDLHTHTFASDGTGSPAKNVHLAKTAGLTGIAITDHDTTAGLEEALEAGRELGIDVVPGIEISSVANGQDIHVLGYFIPLDDEIFLKRLEELRNARQLRNELILEKLKTLGINITMEEVSRKKKEKTGNLGRPHIAEVLVDKGIVGGIQEAFDIYLGKGGKAYANIPRIHPKEAIDLIRSAGGVPILAHPGLYHDDPLVLDLIKSGLAGIEVRHSDHSPEDEQKYRLLAEKYDLIQTAGSDYHGERNGVVFHAPLGSRQCPDSVVERLRNLAASGAND
jgi:hypothetical protein